jgi:predicted phosphohydrolase
LKLLFGKGVAMSLYTISDLHLSLGTDKPMDIFAGWNDYVSKIEKNWLEKIKPHDFVAIPGDISWAMTLEEVKPDFDFLNRLPGRKLILKGNHDYWWATVAKMNKLLKDCGFDTIKFIHNSAAAAGDFSVCGTRGWTLENPNDEDRKILLREAGRLETSIAAAEKTSLEPVVFLHYPPFCEVQQSPIMEVLKKHRIKRCYYGHLHAKTAEKSFEGVLDGISFRLVSCDHIGFSPILVG